MTYFGGQTVPTAQRVGFEGWPALASPTAWLAEVQLEQPSTAASLWLAPGTPAAGAMVSQPLSAGSVRVEALRRQHTAAQLQRCYHWLEQAVQIVPQVSWLVPVLVTAVHQYVAQQYEACLARTLAVIQTVRQMQAAVPTLPSL